MNQTIYAFDKFQIDTQRRLLLCEGQPVQLTSKAFDLLLALIESGGREITKDELMEIVWRDQIVEDANLTVTMSHVRKALGERASENRFIVTIPGRGYRFVGELLAPEGFIIEEHIVSEIVIEDEIDNADEINEKMILQSAETNKYFANPSGATAMSSAIKTLPQANVKSYRQYRSKLFLFGLIVLVLLFVSVFAIWLYRSQQKNQNLPVNVPFNQATIKQLTTKGKVRWAVLSPDGAFYAYTLTEREERKESLWLGQMTGSNEIPLRPPDDVLYNALTFSPDGKMLYFTLSRLSEKSEEGLFKIPALGGVAEKISNKISSHFALSDDGKQIAFLRTNRKDDVTALVITNLDGTQEKELLTRTPDKRFSSNCLAWSQDGSMIAFAAVNNSLKESFELFTVRVANGHIEQLTNLEWSRISSMVWQRDGKGLLLVATNKTETVRHLWQVDYPVGNQHRLSRDTDGYGSALSISADGNSLIAVQLRRESNIWIAPFDDLSKWRQITFSSINGIYGWYGLDWMPDNRIVFTAGIDRTLAIYSMNADGSDIRQITSSGFYDQRPTATPEGQFIVFQSNRSGNNEIWRVNIDGSNLRQLTTGNGNSSPQTTPDGKWVVYTSIRDGKSFVWRIPIEGSEPVQVTNKDCSDPSVSHDGNFIACGYKADDNTPLKLAIVKFEDGTHIKLFDVPRLASFNDGIRWMPDGKAVIYRDKERGIWQQDLGGGQPYKLKGLPEEEIFRYGWSRDGKFFAFTRGRTVSDAVLINNFK